MNNRIRIYLVVFLAFILFCQGCNESVNSLVNKLTGSTLNFDWTKQTLLGDTVIDGIDFHAPLKIVLDVDSTLCEPCLLKYIRACCQYMEYINNDSLMLICIIQPSLVRDIQDSLKGMDLSRVSVVLDVGNNYRKKNSLEKYNRMFSSFLLDVDNRIVLVGDPLRNNSVRQLYEEQIMALVDNNGRLPGTKRR